ncbi:YbbR-like domain-containing protein [Paucisalibacillus sp. EB02]|uniref:CdaR family protein n=1 Tax=Paucisalibacillus sp. EB02 TaxID=1347087 RepID=UPI0004BA478A|nr:CdaR family protein [Paucisalibacillus sp. EB02]
MDNWFRSKWFIRGISLGFAILLYVFVAIEEVDTEEESPISFTTLFGGSNQTQTLEDIPLEIRIDSDKYVVSGVPETVTVSLEGPSSAITPVVKQQNIKVFIDLRDLEEGEHQVEIQHEELSSQLSVYIEPKTIDVMIEERASNDFNVTVDFINTDKLPKGYQIGDYELNTEKVTITSSREIIERIAIVKVYVDVAGLKESINNREVPVNVYDGQGNELAVRVEPGTVVISAEVENPSKEVPVSISTEGELPEGYELTSMELAKKEVEIFAISEILETLDEVTTEPINLSELKQSGTIKVKLALPDEVQAPGIKELEIVVELEQTKTLENVEIEVDNLQDGYIANFVEPSNGQLSITVTGNEQDVRELSIEDFRIFINASELDTGRSKVPIEVEGPDNISVDVEVDEVNVEIEEV